eukprot:gb/GEZN01009714.1/.p1 GENE.gb/GEZN01009714.1/~~gb/GEZN01009714.1/.p1  ORF type:complete len:367 (-),score=45.70 gb/GEZN01009714.1/:95-1195(-)
MLRHSDVLAAAARLQGRIYHTPLCESLLLNQWLRGHRVVFKCENLQRTGAFKVRGALNAVSQLLEQRQCDPAGQASAPWVVAYSSGNHAAAVAWACSTVEPSLRCTVFMPENVSPLKAQATAAYGAKVVLLPTRQEAEQACAEAVVRDGAILIPPFDADAVIAGQGTAILEALQDLSGKEVWGRAGVTTHRNPTPLIRGNCDAIFVPVGGGGLVSGSYLAASGFEKPPLVFGAEPLQANDAAQSFRSGSIVKLTQQPITLADGTMTLALSERTFQYVKQLNDVIEISEMQLRYWTQWLTHLLKQTLEPTAALGMGAAHAWLKTQTEPRTVLVLLSGGNLAVAKHRQVWGCEYPDFLTQLPCLSLDI